MIDYELLQRLSPEQGLAYLREYYAANPSEVQGGNYYAGPTGPTDVDPYVPSLGTEMLVPSGGDRSYVVRRANDGTIDTSQQLADSWYDREVMGIPIGAFLPFAAAGAAAALGPAAAGEGALSGVSGTEALIGGASADTLAGNSIYSIAQPGTAVTMGGSTATMGGAGIGGGALGSGLLAPAAATAAGGGLLSSLGAAAPYVRALLPIAGAIAGAATSGDRTSTQTSNKEPWAPAQDWLKDQIKTGQQLQNYYQQNPFNQVQKTGYQNLLSGVDNFNSSVAPAMMDWVQSYMSGDKNMPLPGQQPAPRALEYGGAGRADMGPNPESEFTGMRRQPQPTAPTSQPRMFGAPTMTPYGQIDWLAMNPYGLLG